MRESGGLGGILSLCHLLSLDLMFPMILTHPFSPVQGSVSPEITCNIWEAFLCILFLQRASRFHQVVRGLSIPPEVLTGKQGAACMHRSLERKLVKKEGR